MVCLSSEISFSSLIRGDRYFGPNRVAPRYSAEKCASDYSQYKDSTTAKVSFYRKILREGLTCVQTWAEIVQHKDKPRTFVKDVCRLRRAIT